VPPLLGAIWEDAAIVAVLLVILYTGHKGYWYWSPGVRALTRELARDRDDWRTLAVTLLRKQGVELPDGYEQAQAIALPGDPDPGKSGR
jgi:hypothetical protein